VGIAESAVLRSGAKRPIGSSADSAHVARTPAVEQHRERSEQVRTQCEQSEHREHRERSEQVRTQCEQSEHREHRERSEQVPAQCAAPSPSAASAASRCGLNHSNREPQK